MPRQSATRSFTVPAAKAGTRFSAAIEAECQRVRSDPAVAGIFGADVLTGTMTAAQRVAQFYKDSEVIIDTVARAAEELVAAMKALEPRRLNPEAQENFGRALDVLQTAAEPVLETGRFAKNAPRLERELRDYIAAAKTLPATAPLTDRISFMEGSLAAFSIFEDSRKGQARAPEFSRLMRNVKLLLKDLPEDHRRALQQIDAELGLFTGGIAEAVPVGKPLRLTPRSPTQ